MLKINQFIAIFYEKKKSFLFQSVSAFLGEKCIHKIPSTPFPSAAYAIPQPRKSL